MSRLDYCYKSILFCCLHVTCLYYTATTTLTVPVITSETTTTTTATATAGVTTAAVTTTASVELTTEGQLYLLKANIHVSSYYWLDLTHSSDFYTS